MGFARVIAVGEFRLHRPQRVAWLRDAGRGFPAEGFQRNGTMGPTSRSDADSRPATEPIAGGDERDDTG